MDNLKRVIDALAANYSNQAITTTTIASVLCMVLVLAVYEYVIYRVVSHRAFYNKAFHISITIIPFFIATIVLSLQSNLVITLGTIGALAIIRFRTAVKDPVDMVYILWSVHIGITCGCQLYELAVLTSLLVTIVLVVLNYVRIGRAPYTLVLHCEESAEAQITRILKKSTQRFRFKSRNYTAKGLDLVAEVTLKDAGALTKQLSQLEAIERFSLIEYDTEDVV